MSPRLAHELTALADGTLPPKRRDTLLRRVSASPKLARALKEQLIAIEAIRRLDTPAPPELRVLIHRVICEAWARQQSASPTAMTRDRKADAREDVASGRECPIGK